MIDDHQPGDSATLRKHLEERLSDMPGVSIGCWKETELVCLFFHGKEFAHFHGETILDLRLSPKIIRQEQLSRSISSRIHPNRSKNSRWIGIEFKTRADIDQLIGLIEQACSVL